MIADTVIQLDKDGKGFSIYAFMPGKVIGKRYLVPFSAKEINQYTADWESWPEITGVELATLKHVYHNKFKR